MRRRFLDKIEANIKPPVLLIRDWTV